MDAPCSTQFMDAPRSLIPGPGDRIFYGERARTYFLRQSAGCISAKTNLAIKDKNKPKILLEYFKHVL